MQPSDTDITDTEARLLEEIRLLRQERAELTAVNDRLLECLHHAERELHKYEQLYRSHVHGRS